MMVFVCLILIVIVFIRMIQKFAGFSLTVIDLFLLGLVLTQCGPYVIYSFGLGEMPVYLNDCAATEWSLLHWWQVCLNKRVNPARY